MSVSQLCVHQIDECIGEKLIDPKHHWLSINSIVTFIYLCVCLFVCFGIQWVKPESCFWLVWGFFFKEWGLLTEQNQILFHIFSILSFLYIKLFNLTLNVFFNSFLMLLIFHQIFFVFAVFEDGSFLILEPVMSVEVAIPSEYESNVLVGLNRRHSVILGTDSNEGYSTLFCEVKSNFS